MLVVQSKVCRSNCRP